LRDAEFPMARMEAHLHAYKADAALFLYKATNDLEWAKKGYKGYMRSAELSRVVRGQRQVDEGHELYAYSIASEIAFKIFYELAIKYGLPVSLKLIAGLNDRNMTCDDRSNTLRFGIKDEELAHVIKWGNRCIESKSASGDKFRSKDRVRASLCYRDAAVVAADLFFYTENSQYLDTVLRSFKSSLSVLGKDNFEQRHDVTSDIRNFIQGYVKLDCYFNKGLKDKARISSLRDFAAFIYYDYSDNSEHVQPGAGDLVESISVNMNLGDLAKFVSTNSDSAFDIAKWAARARSAYTTAIKRYDQSSAAKADMVLTTHIAYALGFASSVSETLFSLFKNAERERASPSKVSSEIGIAE